jgi:hypothetical protein
VGQVQMLVLALLVVEGVGACLGAVALVVTILRGLMAHRMAVFSVFLAIPNTALRALANKSTNIGDEEEEEDSDNGGRERARRGAARLGWQQEQVCCCVQQRGFRFAWHCGLTPSQPPSPAAAEEAKAAEAEAATRKKKRSEVAAADAEAEQDGDDADAGGGGGAGSARRRVSIVGGGAAAGGALGRVVSWRGAGAAGPGPPCLWTRRLFVPSSRAFTPCSFPSRCPTATPTPPPGQGRAVAGGADGCGHEGAPQDAVQRQAHRQQVGGG